MIGDSYLKSLWLSISTPAYYLSLIREKVSTTLFFLAVSCLWLGIINALFFTTQILPPLKADLLQALDQLQTSYPAELTLAWNGLKLEMMPAEQVTVPLPKLASLPKTALPPTAMLLSPTDLSPTELETRMQTSLAVVTPTDAYLKNQTSWGKLPLTELPGFEEEFTLNQASLPSYIDTWKAALENAYRYRWVMYIVSPIQFFLTNLWTSAINAGLVFFILRLVNVRLRYKTIFTFSAHVVVVALMLVQIQQWLYRDLSLPLFTLCYWILMAFIIWYIRQQAEQRLKAVGK